MKTSTKAALLSAFVFPGVGHLYLKKYLAAAILAGASLAAIYYLVSSIIHRALEIAERIQTSGVPLSTQEIAELVSRQSSGTDALFLNVATIVVIVCWVIGIVDSYRVGSARDKSAEITREG